MYVLRLAAAAAAAAAAARARARSGRATRSSASGTPRRACTTRRRRRRSGRTVCVHRRGGRRRGGRLTYTRTLAVVGDRTRCSGDGHEHWGRRVGLGGTPNGRGGASVEGSVVSWRPWRLTTAVGGPFLDEPKGALGPGFGAWAGGVRCYVVWPPKVSGRRSRTLPSSILGSPNGGMAPMRPPRAP